MKLVSTQQPLSRRNFLEFLNLQVVSRVVLNKLHSTEQTLTPSRTKSQFLEQYCEVVESLMDIFHQYLILREVIGDFK